MILLAFLALDGIALGLGGLGALLLRNAQRRRTVGPRWAVRLARVLAVELLLVAAALLALGAHAAVILVLAQQ